MNDWYVDMAFAVLFGVLREKKLIIKYERAFFKMHQALGRALEINLIGTEEVKPAEESRIYKP